VKGDTMTTSLNASIQMEFRVIDGLSVRYGECGDQSVPPTPAALDAGDEAALRP
jgi:hypothetical protein